MKYLATIFLILFASLAMGAETVGLLDFSQGKYWPKQGLVDYIDPDVGIQGGDIMPPAIGDFESFTGTIYQNCQACPTGWECWCFSDTGSDITQDSTYATSGSYAVSMDPQVDRTNRVGYNFTFEQNEVYMISVWARSTDGTEDFTYAICDSVDNLNQGCYLPSTRVFNPTGTGSPQSFSDFLNVPTTWSRYTIFINGDPASDLTRAITLMGTTTDGTRLFFDRFEIFKLNNQGIPVGTSGNSYPMFYTGSAPFRNESMGLNKDCLLKDSAGPARINCYRVLDVTAGGLVTDTAVESDYNSLNHETYGSFTAACRYIIDINAAGTSGIMSKHPNGWYCAGRTSPGCYHYNEDGTYASTGATNATPTQGAINSICYSVQNEHMETNNTSTIRMYTGTTYATDTTAAAPTKSNTSSWALGTFAGGQHPLNGSILECAYWQGAKSEAQCMKWNHPYSPGVEYGEGMWLDYCSEVSPARCSYNRCVNGQKNYCDPDFTGAYPVFIQETELQDNNSFETYSVSEENPTITDFTQTEYPSDEAFIKMYPYDSFHGNYSLKMETTTTSSNARVKACVPVNSSTDYYVSVWAKKLSGDADMRITAKAQYTSADCSTGSIAGGTVEFAREDPATNWKEYGSVTTTLGTANSMEINVYGNYNKAGTVLVDAFTIKQTSYRKPWVHCESGSGTCSTTKRIAQYHNPLSDDWDGEKGGIETGYCMGGWFYTDWGYTETVNHYLLNSVSVPSAPKNKIAIYYNTFGSKMVLNHTRASGNNNLSELAISDTSWTPGYWKYVEACVYQDAAAGIVKAHHYNTANSTWYDWSTSTGANTQQDDIDTVIWMGGENEAAGDVYLQGYIYQFYISEWSATYPKKYFNDGKAPPDPY